MYWPEFSIMEISQPWLSIVPNSPVWTPKNGGSLGFAKVNAWWGQRQASFCKIGVFCDSRSTPVLPSNLPPLPTLLPCPPRLLCPPPSCTPFSWRRSCQRKPWSLFPVTFLDPPIVPPPPVFQPKGGYNRGRGTPDPLLTSSLITT